MAEHVLHTLLFDYCSVILVCLCFFDFLTHSFSEILEFEADKCLSQQKKGGFSCHAAVTHEKMKAICNLSMIYKETLFFLDLSEN